MNKLHNRVIRVNLEASFCMGTILYFPRTYVFQTVMLRNQLPRMFSTNQARYSTVIFLAWSLQVCNFNDRNHLPIFHRKVPKTRHERSPPSPLKRVYTYTGSLRKNHTPETGSLRIRKTYGGSWLWHPLQVGWNIVSRRQQYKETLGSGYTISLTWVVHRYFESPLYFVVAIATTN